MSSGTVIILIIAILAIAVAGWALMEKRRTERLRTKFGPEYDRVVQQGDRRTAESALEKRAKRVESFHIHPLPPEERGRFAAAWTQAQARFVDEPRVAVRNADRLVGDVMQTRGYPMGEFEQQAADISVDHPQGVENYRAAHELALRDLRGQATTEDLRQAMIYYPALFAELIDEPALEPHEARR